MAVMAVMDLWGDPDLFLLFAGPAELGDSQGTQLSWPHFQWHMVRHIVVLRTPSPAISMMEASKTCSYYDILIYINTYIMYMHVYIYIIYIYYIYICSTFLLDVHEFSMSTIYTYLAQVVPSSPMKVSPWVWSTGTPWRVTRVTRVTRNLGAPGAPETLNARSDDGVCLMGKRWWTVDDRSQTCWIYKCIYIYIYLYIYIYIII